MNSQALRKMDDTDTAEISSEADRVITWRLKALVEVGYPSELAFGIAEDTSIDLHQAVELVATGCPPETAARILL